MSNRAVKIVHSDTYLHVVQDQSGRISCGRLRHFKQRKILFLLKDAPKPSMGWKSVASDTTISALAAGPGALKLTGEDIGMRVN